MPTSSIVYVVDDDVSLREALDSLLRSAGLQVATFSSAQEFLHQWRADGVGCLVLDIRLPDQSGLELQRELATVGAAIPIIFITGHGDIATTVRAMKAGAVEFLPKPFHEQELLDAVQQALSQSRAFLSQRTEKNALATKFNTLTSREREVMKQIIQGTLNKQIAASLGLSVVTIKVHRRHLMKKMGAASLAELVRLANRLSP